jgi:hypothetical protein
MGRAYGTGADRRVHENGSQLAAYLPVAFADDVYAEYAKPALCTPIAFEGWGLNLQGEGRGGQW